MKYSVKDLSNILGIATSAIHFFEKENLIKVSKEKNGWRYYNVVDVFRLLSYTKYKNMEMPMKAIVKQFNGEESSYLSTNFLKESGLLQSSKALLTIPVANIKSSKYVKVQCEYIPNKGMYFRFFGINHLKSKKEIIFEICIHHTYSRWSNECKHISKN
jgi:DNA-binding transcriptional MerR regulator